MAKGEDPDEGNEADSSKAIAMAGFTILESLLLSLMERGILDEREVRGLLTDAANAHRQQTKKTGDAELHRRTAELIEGLRKGGNSTRMVSWPK